MAAFDDAVAELYQAPVETFVAERKRLAAALKAAGDKAAATTLAKLGRPTLSAWVVNQLWWHARDAFEALLVTAARLRDGHLDATTAHREAIAKLRARAATMLADAGHGTTESTLRRVTMTLSAIAATGGFDPDPPGALAGDRDPPGFEAAGIAAIAPSPKHEDARPAAAPVTKPDAAEQERLQAAHEARERAEAAAERRKHEQALARRAADRSRVETALETATGEVRSRQRERARVVEQLAAIDASIERARSAVVDLEAKLRELAAHDRAT